MSDSHGSDTAVLKAHTAAGAVDAVFHLGDGEEDCNMLLSAGVNVSRVAGNCDLGSQAPRELLIEMEGKRLLLVHGDKYGVKLGLSRIAQRGAELNADAVLYGHSHLALIEQSNDLLLINPGTLWQNAPFRSYAIIEVDQAGIQATIYPLVS